MVSSSARHCRTTSPNSCRQCSRWTPRPAWLEPLFALLKEETQASAPGAAAIFAKLADVFVTQALRSYLAAADGLARLPLPALSDPGIARIVKMIRARPEARWSVDAMAQAAGMSRTSFNARFRAAVGQPPMTYLTELRLRRAAGYLSTTTKNVRQVAHLVGYDNEASFSKAFSRRFARPPGEYRHERLASPQQLPGNVSRQRRAVPIQGGTMIMRVSCDCGWTFEGQDAELVAAVQEHGRTVHGMSVTAEEALAMAQPV